MDQAVGGPGIVLHVPVAGVWVLFVQIYSSPSSPRVQISMQHRADAESREDETMNDAPWATSVK